MAKNLEDLNEALHDQLNKLMDATGEDLKIEVERSRATANLAHCIIENGKLALQAHQCLGGKKDNPKLLGVAE